MKKPIKKFNRWLRITGCYDLCNTTKEEAKYTFYLRPECPEGLRGFYTIGFDWEPDPPDDTAAIDVVIGLIEGYKDYWFAGRVKEELQMLLEYLESVENEDCRDKLKYDLDYAAYKVDFWTDRLHKAEKVWERVKQ